MSDIPAPAPPSETPANGDGGTFSGDGVTDTATVWQKRLPADPLPPETLPDLPTRNMRCPRCGGKIAVPDGDFLRRTREDRGLSLREVARRIGISAPYLSDLERNNRTLGNPVLAKLRKCLHV